MRIGKIILSGMGVVLGVASTIAHSKDFVGEIKNAKIDHNKKEKTKNIKKKQK